MKFRIGMFCVSMVLLSVVTSGCLPSESRAALEPDLALIRMSPTKPVFLQGEPIGIQIDIDNRSGRISGTLGWLDLFYLIPEGRIWFQLPPGVAYDRLYLPTVEGRAPLIYDITMPLHRDIVRGMNIEPLGNLSGLTTTFPVGEYRIPYRCSYRCGFDGRAEEEYVIHGIIEFTVIDPNDLAVQD